MSTNVFVPKVKPEHVVSFGDAIFAFAITPYDTINRYT
jgi:hypothetical protein